MSFSEYRRSEEFQEVRENAEKTSAPKTQLSRLEIKYNKSRYGGNGIGYTVDGVFYKPGSEGYAAKLRADAGVTLKDLEIVKKSGSIVSLGSEESQSRTIKKKNGEILIEKTTIKTDENGLVTKIIETSDGNTTQVKTINPDGTIVESEGGPMVELASVIEDATPIEDINGNLLDPSSKEYQELNDEAKKLLKDNFNIEQVDEEDLNKLENNIDALKDDNHNFNNSTPFEGGTEVKNDAPKMKVQYPYNWVQQTSAGHRIEMNNTKGAERVRILNGNGNFLDMDELKNNSLVSYNDTYILSDHNLVIKVGTDVENDKCVLQVVGDVHLYVEGDMHTEVEGDRYDRVNGNWQQECGGVMTTRAEENLAITSKNTMKLKSNSYVNTTTFLLNDLSEGGSIKENVKGNYEVKIQKPTATFSVKSDGDVRIQSNMCRYDFIGRNYMTEVRGKVSTQVEGNDLECINGGAFEGMVNIAPFPNSSYDITVTGNTSLSNTGNYNISASGNVNIAGTEIYLN